MPVALPSKNTQLELKVYDLAGRLVVSQKVVDAAQNITLNAKNNRYGSSVYLACIYAEGKQLLAIPVNVMEENMAARK